MAKQGIILLFLFLFPSYLAIANEDEFLVLRVEHAQLAKKNIESIAQDHSGFMWFGSGNGLIRYDGRSVRIFNYEIDNHESLPNSRVRDIYSDSNGVLWATTQGGGISKFNPYQRQFSNFTPSKENTAQSNINNFDFWTIRPANGDYLWVSSFGGNIFYKFNRVTQEFTSFQVPVSEGRSNTSTTVVIGTSTNEIWVGTDEDGILVFNENGQFKTRFVNDANNPLSLGSDSIRDMVEDVNGNIWIATYTGGLNKYDPYSGTFSRLSSLNFDKPGIFNNFYTLLLGENNELWAGTDDGLLLIDVDTYSIINHYAHNPLSERSLSNNRVRAIYKDAGGTYWVGNENGGVHKIIRTSNFTHITPDADNPKKLSHPIVRTFLQYDESTLWVGTQGGGISALDKETLQVKRQWLHDPSNPRSLSHNGLTALLDNPNGGVWVGTWSGLNYYDPSTNSFQRYLSEPGNANSLTDNRIQSLNYDSKGNLWVGTENGLNIYRPETDDFKQILHHESDPNSLHGLSIQSRSFVEDENDIYWIGTWQGLIRYDKSNNSIKRYVNEPNNIQSISSNHVLSVHDDGMGSLWIGTFSGGLNHMDKETGTFSTYLDTDGLPSNVVFAIIPDSNNNLWLSTNSGLVQFDPQNRTFRTFSDLDGLTSIEFWWGAAYKDNDGYIYFGSVYGFTQFHPDQIITNTYTPPVVISSMKIFDKPVVIPENHRIEIDYRDNYFTIEFASLDYSNPLRNQYAYKLEGLDRDWIYSGNRNVVSYSFLKGGQYTFQVKGTNSDGVWNEESTHLHLFIRPPYWQTTWFYTFVIFGFLLLIWTIDHFRTNSVQRANKQLEEEVNRRTKDLANKQEEILKRNIELKNQTVKLQLQKAEIEQQRNVILGKTDELLSKNKELILLNEEKNNLMGIVAHDLRSPLASLTSALQMLQMEPEMPQEEMLNIYSMMGENIEKQLKMISKVLDIDALESGQVSIQFEKINIDAVGNRVVKQYIDTAQKKNIQIETAFEIENAPILADTNYLDQVIDNLLSNAIKFSPEGSTVRVITKKHGKSVRLGVQDAGPGISAQDQAILFDKYKKLSAKPTGGEKSTGIGLSIVKRFTEAMNGKVWCDSQLTKGATMWIEFELVND
ncbi:MAG: hypothetical protein LAT57_08325 [Balneolales bacterium]|nr:hypothetical protein [Balneolales bacterium]